MPTRGGLVPSRRAVLFADYQVMRKRPRMADEGLGPSSPARRFCISVKWIDPVDTVSLAQEDAMIFFAAADAVCNLPSISIWVLLGLIRRSKKVERHSVRPTDCGEHSRQEPIDPYVSILLKAPGIRIRVSAEAFCSSAKHDAELSCAMSNTSTNKFNHRTM